MAGSTQSTLPRLRRGTLGCALVILLVTGCARQTPPSAPTAVEATPTVHKPSTPSGTHTAATTAAATTEAPPAAPTPAQEAPASLPIVPGMTSDQVASLATLEQIDDYPLYVMHVYGDASLASTGGIHGTPARRGFACSLFAALGDSKARLYGRNYDWDYSPALVLFAHPGDGYDSVSIVDIAYNGLEGTLGLADVPIAERGILLDALGVPFDGMNEMGVTIGMAAVPDSLVPYDASLPDTGSLGIIREMLDHAATVEEALEILRGHNVHMAGGPHIHYLIADADGNAALVEFYRGETVVLDQVGAWHLATNHFRAPVDEGATQMCRRYARLSEALTQSEGSLTVDEAMALLSDVAQSSTQWSAIYDMVRLELHVALGRDYGEVYTLGMGAVTGNR